MLGFGRALRLFPVRLAIYALIEGLLLHGLVVSITAGNVGAFAEDAWIEWLHFTVMTCAGSLFLWSWYRENFYRLPLLLCGMLSFVAALRELDHFSEILLFEDAYKYPIVIIGFVAFYLLVKQRHRIPDDVADFAKQPAFFFLAFGSFLTAIVAQILGQAELWHGIVDGPGARAVKRVVEESLETMGYILLFFGALEARLATAVRLNRSALRV
jgi:hypothetical protein